MARVALNCRFVRFRGRTGGEASITSKRLWCVGVFLSYGIRIKKGLTRFERFAVFIGEAVLVDSCDVGSGAIADMFVEAIVWVLGSKLYHVLVAGNFSDNGSSGDFTDFSIRFYASRNIVFEWSVA